MTHQISILNTQIRTLDNLYSLNDLHKISGSEDKHMPFRFMRNEQTQELIQEIQKDFGTPDLVFKILRGKNIQGTYACEELVLAYAMWISPKFHLIVLRAFLAMHKNQALQQPQQIALPEPPKTYTRTLTEEQWLGFASLWYCLYNCVELLDKIEKPLNALRSPLGIDARTHVQEYHISLGISKRLLAPLLAEFDVDPRERHYFHALKTLREYKPFGVGKLARV